MAIIATLPHTNLFVHKPNDHLSVHLILELFSIIVSAMVVSVAWTGLRQKDLLLAKPLIFGFTIIACADLLHALTYEGMPSLLVDGDTNIAIFFWFVGRSFEIITVALILAKISLPGSRLLWFMVALATTAYFFFLGTLGQEHLPATYTPNSGVTPFKIGYEIAISLANFMLAFKLFSLSRKSSDDRLLWLGAGCFIMGVGELSFISYTTNSEILVVLGHLYKIGSYTLIYISTFKAIVQEPYKLLQKTSAWASAKELEQRNLLESLPVGIARLNSQLEVTYKNAKFLTTVHAQDCTNNTLQYNPITTNPLYKQILPALRASLAGERHEQVFEFLTAEGELNHIHAIIVPENQDSGNNGGILLSLTNTTEHEQNRRDLLAAERENQGLKVALDAHAMITITDASGIVTHANDKFCETSKYARNEIVGHPHDQVYSKDFNPELFQSMWDTIKHGEVWNGELCNLARDDSRYWVHTTVVPFLNEQRVPVRYIVIGVDVTSRKNTEIEAQQQALHDALTGLPNRRLMADRLAQEIDSKSRNPSYSAIILMDLDFFKQINDTQGHLVGDELLRQVSARLTRSVRQADTVARLGGDEFLIILSNVGADPVAATANSTSMTEKIRSALNEPFQLDEHVASITTSLGAITFCSSEEDPETLISRADIALYSAKEHGRNQVCFYDPSLQEKADKKSLLAHDLELAFKKNEIEILYQPLVDEQNSIFGFEAIIEWRHPIHGPICPFALDSLIEQSGLSIPISSRSITSACQQLAEWQDMAYSRNWTIVINVTTRHLLDSHFINEIKQLVSAAGVIANRLVLELSEENCHAEFDSIAPALTTLSEAGIAFCLGNFGNQILLLTQIKNLPFSTIKIKKSITTRIFEHPVDAALTQSIIALSNILGATIIATDIENQLQVDWLIENGCTHFQGPHFRKPLSMLELKSLKSTYKSDTH